MRKLKEEINFRYNLMRYKKLTKRQLYQYFEKNNLHIIYQALEEMKVFNENKRSF